MSSIDKLLELAQARGWRVSILAAPDRPSDCSSRDYPTHIAILECGQEVKIVALVANGEHWRQVRDSICGAPASHPPLVRDLKAALQI